MASDGAARTSRPTNLALAVVFICSTVAAFASSTPTETNSRPTVIVAVGAAGEEDFGSVFRRAGEQWEKAAHQGGVNFIGIGLTNSSSTNDLDELRGAIAHETKSSSAELWLVLLGHGTFDGKEAKFNLRGPDLAASDLAKWLEPFHRPIAVINAASSSAPFMKALAHTNRVIVTATKSGSEQNYARFSKYISEAIADPAADLDKDGQTSLLEAFLMASRGVTEWYESEGRLASEHALLDDNADGLGTPATWFRGIRAVKTASQGSALDGVRAHQWHLIRSTEDEKLSPEQRKQRDELELEVSKLRDRKSHMNEDEYYAALEKLLTSLAELQSTNESAAPSK